MAKRFKLVRDDGAEWIPDVGYVKNGRVVSTTPEWEDSGIKKKKNTTKKSSGSSSKSKSTYNPFKNSSDPFDAIANKNIDVIRDIAEKHGVDMGVAKDMYLTDIRNSLKGYNAPRYGDFDITEERKSEYQKAYDEGLAKLDKKNYEALQKVYSNRLSRAKTDTEKQNIINDWQNISSKTQFGVTPLNQQLQTTTIPGLLPIQTYGQQLYPEQPVGEQQSVLPPLFPQIPQFKYNPPNYSITSNPLGTVWVPTLRKQQMFNQMARDWYNAARDAYNTAVQQAMNRYKAGIPITPIGSKLTGLPEGVADPRAQLMRKFLSGAELTAEEKSILGIPVERPRPVDYNELVENEIWRKYREQGYDALTPQEKAFINKKLGYKPEELDNDEQEIIKDDLKEAIERIFKGKTQNDRKQIAQEIIQLTEAKRRSGLISDAYANQYIQGIYAAFPNLKPKPKPVVNRQQSNIDINWNYLKPVPTLLP